MKLNYDCLYEILFYLEENLLNKPLKIRNIINEFQNKYSYDDMIYAFKNLTNEKLIKISTNTCTHHSLIKEITFKGHKLLKSKGDDSMNNPLKHFEDRMINFELYRNSNFISTIKGLKNSYQGRKYIEFFPDVDIKIGDILINSNINYYVIEIDTQTWMGNISSIQAFYQTTPIQEIQPNSTIYNINNASNAIIGNQQSAIINNSNFDINQLKDLIELYGANDKEQLYELTDLLKQSLEKDDFKKSKLSKFSDLIAKHSWLPLAIAQVVASFLSQ